MASQLLSCQGLREPGERLIYQLSVPCHNTFRTGEEFWLNGRPTFNNFINGRSFLLWSAQNFVDHQLSQVKNFWSQRRPAVFRFCFVNRLYRVAPLREGPSLLSTGVYGLGDNMLCETSGVETQ